MRCSVLSMHFRHQSCSISHALSCRANGMPEVILDHAQDLETVYLRLLGRWMSVRARDSTVARRISTAEQRKGWSSHLRGLCRRQRPPPLVPTPCSGSQIRWHTHRYGDGRRYVLKDLPFVPAFFKNTADFSKICVYLSTSVLAIRVERLARCTLSYGAEP